MREVLREDEKEKKLNLIERIVHVEEGINSLSEQIKLVVETTNKRFDEINKRFDDNNKRFEDINKRFDTHLAYYCRFCLFVNTPDINYDFCKIKNIILFSNNNIWWVYPFSRLIFIFEKMVIFSPSLEGYPPEKACQSIY